ncbi:MAG TPA: hypothetical protein VGQ84_03140 [Gaiellaceae bacterium]|jgi:hypothetical protein|nr:hypothetical protein [Gaiellaceae bacterium]
MRRLLTAACVLAVAFTAGVIAPASLAEDEPQPAPITVTGGDIGEYLLDDITAARKETWRWERLMRMPYSQTSRSAERSNEAAHRRWVLKMWKQKAALRKRQANHPPRLGAWLCINRFEGRWTDPNAPYYGGLQMDIAFQRTYAPELLRKKGTADKWTPVEQIWVAERAYRSGRGFTPWPNTARSCGLL